MKVNLTKELDLEWVLNTKMVKYSIKENFKIITNTVMEHFIMKVLYIKDNLIKIENMEFLMLQKIHKSMKFASNTINNVKVLFI